MSKKKCKNCLYFSRNQNINRKSYDTEYLCGKGNYDTLFSDADACEEFEDDGFNFEEENDD